MALEPGSPGPQSLVSRPAAWGGLSVLLDTRAKRATAIVVILAAMAAAPLLGPYAVVILTNALLYTILALGLNIVVGYAGLLDLGYAAFFAVGAYSVGILTTVFGWNFWATIPVAVLAAMLAGVIIGGPTLRLRSDYLAIATIGISEILRALIGEYPLEEGIRLLKRNTRRYVKYQLGWLRGMPHVHYVRADQPLPDAVDEVTRLLGSEPPHSAPQE